MAIRSSDVGASFSEDHGAYSPVVHVDCGHNLSKQQVNDMKYRAVFWAIQPNDEWLPCPMWNEDGDWQDFDAEEASALIGIEVEQLKRTVEECGRCDGAEHTVWKPQRDDEVRPSTELDMDDSNEEEVWIRRSKN